MAPRPTEGLVHAHESASGDDARGHRRAVDDEAADAVLDLRHDLHALVERLTVGPVRDQREQLDGRRTTGRRRAALGAAASPRSAVKPTPHVPLSAGRVRIETEP